MGIVYRARQSNMQRDVALKVLRGTLLGQPDKMKRFRREAQLISRLEHPNIVRVFAVGVADGQPYIAMEYLSGRQLSEIIERDGPMPWRSAVKLFLQLCDALEYAHGREIIHRDIKPSNIVIVADPSSGESCLKLVDFGIAKSTGGQQLTRTEMVVGSAFYLSPGQFQGRSADVRSDVYSFGCALFEVLTGTVPFRGDTIYDTIQNKTNNNLGRVNEINSQAEIPSDLQRLLEWMTHSESEFRPPSIDAVRQALHSILDGKPVAFTSAPVPSRTPDRVSGSARLRLSAIVACAVILLIGLIYLFSTQWLERPAAKPVQLGAFLTDSAKERQLASQVNNRSSEESVLVQAYIQLSVLYCENHFKLPGLLCVERALALAERSNMQNSQMYADALYRKATLLRDLVPVRETRGTARVLPDSS
jgi:serine/threonine protein kinase